MLFDHSLVLLEGDAVFALGVCSLAQVGQRRAQSVVARRQPVAVFGDVGVLVYQALVLLERGAVLGLSRRWPAPPQQKVGQGVMGEG
jgi:hypothetical protein